MWAFGHADHPGAIAQAEVLTQHIEAATLQRVGGRHGQGLAAGLRDAVVSPCVMLSCRPCQVWPTRPRVTVTLEVKSGPPTEAMNG